MLDFAALLARARDHKVSRQDSKILQGQSILITVGRRRAKDIRRAATQRHEATGERQSERERERESDRETE